jgi:hypothetical protein
LFIVLQKLEQEHRAQADAEHKKKGAAGQEEEKEKHQLVCTHFVFNIICFTGYLGVLDCAGVAAGDGVACGHHGGR